MEHYVRCAECGFIGWVDEERVKCPECGAEGRLHLADEVDQPATYPYDVPYEPEEDEVEKED